MDPEAAFKRAEEMTRQYAAAFDKEGIDDFVKKAEDIQKQVADIVSGKTDIEEADRMDREREQMERSKKALKEQERIEALMKGRPGKGHKPGYKLYCPRCQTEYMIDGLTKCTHCGNEHL